MSVDAFSLVPGGAVAPDLEQLEETLRGLITGIEPIQVELFPARWSDYVRDRLGNLDGAVLLALRSLSAVEVDESRIGWAVQVDFVVLFKSYAFSDGHLGGYAFLESVIMNLHERAFTFEGVQYTSKASQAVFVAREGEHWIWTVRAEVRPTLSLR